MLYFPLAILPYSCYNRQARAEIAKMETAAQVAAAQAVADAERTMRDRLDAARDELTKVKDNLHQTQTALATVTAERDRII